MGSWIDPRPGELPVSIRSQHGRQRLQIVVKDIRRHLSMRRQHFA
jgi:hypothetical protein